MLNPLGLIALIICITIHEFAHSWTADKLGDPTPRANGRLSLNPLRHLDPLGTIMIIFVGIGWGKPVPVDSYNFRNPRRDEILVALSGAVANLILATIIAILTKISGINFSFFTTLIIMNVSLAIFNLLPIPPLDGSKVFLNLLPLDTAIEWQNTFDRYGFFLLAVLLFLPFGNTNLIAIIMTPIVRMILSVLL